MKKRIVRTKDAIKSKTSDHNPILTKLKIKWNRKLVKPRIEMFNFKNKEGQDKFKLMTSETNEFTEIFNNNMDINVCTKNFLRCLNKHIQMFY